MKPVVHYISSKYDHIKEGESAILAIGTVDHYATDRVSNTKAVRTSTVVKIHGEGKFETQNTMYEPHHE